MKKIRFALVAVLALAFLPACKVLTPGEDGQPSTLCSWAFTAEAACGNAQPIPTPSDAVKAELLGRVELQRQRGIDTGVIVGTACMVVHQIAEACRNGQPIPPIPANVARDFAHDDSR